MMGDGAQLLAAPPTVCDLAVLGLVSGPDCRFENT